MSLLEVNHFTFAAIVSRTRKSISHSLMGFVIFREVYNIVDDDPVPREEVFEYARNLIEKKWPGQLKQFSVQDDISVTDKKEGVLGEKRVSNARMKKELGVRLLHSSYKSGLQIIIDQMENPFR